VFDKKLFEALPEKDLIAESMEALVVVLENWINPFQGLAHRVFAEVVVERLEIEEIDATERASGLVAVWARAGTGVVAAPGWRVPATARVPVPMSAEPERHRVVPAAHREPRGVTHPPAAHRERQERRAAAW
jgi:hypothetical protein